MLFSNLRVSLRRHWWARGEKSLTGYLCGAAGNWVSCIMNEKESLYLAADHRSLPQLRSERLNDIYFSCTARPLKMNPVGCPRTSVTDYQTTLPNIPEERRFPTPRIVRCPKNTRVLARHRARKRVSVNLKVLTSPSNAETWAWMVRLRGGTSRRILSNRVADIWCHWMGSRYTAIGSHSGLWARTQGVGGSVSNACVGLHSSWWLFRWR